MPIVLAGVSCEECERLFYRCKREVDWRNAERVDDSATLLATAEAPLKAFLHEACDESWILQNLSRPFELLVDEKPKVRLNRLVRAHVAKHLPRNSLIKLSEHLYVCAPEFRLLECARKLYLPAQLVRGYELCGIHLKDPESEDGFVECIPRTSPELFAQYLDGCDGAHGVKQSRVLLRYLKPNSRSPMESVITVILVLPARWGGYGLKDIELNVPIKTGHAGVYGSAGSLYKADIFFPDIKVDLEYDGWRHSVPGAKSSDNHRRIVLENAGVTVITVSYGDASNVSTMNAIVERIKRMRGIQGPPPSRETLLARNELFASLMPSGSVPCNPSHEIANWAARGRLSTI